MIKKLVGVSRDEMALCVMEVECTFESFHVHALPEGLHLDPGDRVIISDVPLDIKPGVLGQFYRQASIKRAGFIRRLWARQIAKFQICELYHCGFEPKGVS